MISTRGRYAIRVMLDLADHGGVGGYVPMKDVAARQDISLKYLEKIMPLLTAARLVEGLHGKGGGYRLTRPPEDYRMWDILRLTEGDLAPVACLGSGATPCPRSAGCRTLGRWEEYYRLTREYCSGITLADLLRAPTEPEYVI